MRLVKEIMREVQPDPEGVTRMQTSACSTLQEGLEYYLVGLFMDAYKITQHHRVGNRPARITLQPKDIRLALQIRGERDEEGNTTAGALTLGEIRRDKTPHITDSGRPKGTRYLDPRR